MKEYAGKRLLVLGGAAYHLKVVRAASEMGVYTIVTDYLPVEDAPCKRIADKSYQLDITDIDAVVEMCRREHIDGVLGAWMDPCQEPYFEICHRLGVPCYMDNREQLTCLTDKEAFKLCCKKYNVDTILGYEVEDIYGEDAAKRVQFPVMVKPGRNRGSRGCEICNTLEETRKVVERARKISNNGRVIIEKYVRNANMLCLTFLAVNGEIYLLRASDELYGTIAEGIDKVTIGAVMPSRLMNQENFQSCCRNVKRMLRGLGITNGPVYFQCLEDGDKICLYDPGFRFPGSNTDVFVEQATGVDVTKKMIEFALTGAFSSKYGQINDHMAFFNGYVCCLVKPAVREGRIVEIKGEDEIMRMPEVIDCFSRRKPGDIVPKSGTTSQMASEFTIIAQSPSQCREVIKRVLDIYEVLDEEGRSMVISHMNADCLEWGKNEKVV